MSEETSNTARTTGRPAPPGGAPAPAPRPHPAPAPRPHPRLHPRLPAAQHRPRPRGPADRSSRSPVPIAPLALEATPAEVPAAELAEPEQPFSV